MATKVKSAAEVAKKWAEVTPGRQQYYQANAGAAGSDWETNTAAAAGNFAAAVAAGNIKNMFIGGVKRAGAAKYTRKITTVGAGRFGQGISAAVEDMERGVEPFLATIASVTPPARAPRGSASNTQRMVVYATALNLKRLALRAAGA